MSEEKSINYDPNYFCGGRMTIQIVRVTLQIWEYKKTFDVKISGNCRGMNILDAAVSSLYDDEKIVKSHPDFDDVLYVDLEGSDGELFRVIDDFGEGEQWIKNLVVSAEIIHIEKMKEA